GGRRERGVFSNGVVVVGTFAHVALSADGSMIRLYINGQLDTTVPQGVIPPPSTFPFQIGSSRGVTNGFFFPGTIDEVHLFNRAVSDAEIQAIYGAGSAGLSSAPDLTITKTHTGSIVQGQTGATYTITISNAGAGSTAGVVTLVDTLPGGLTPTAISGTGWTCVLGSLTCTRS